MISKDKALGYLKELRKHSQYEHSEGELAIDDVIETIESGMFDLPGAEYNRALDDVKKKIAEHTWYLADQSFSKDVNQAIESLRKPSKISSKADEVAEALKAKFGPEKMEFTESDLAEHPSLRAIESPSEGEESGEI